MQSRARVVVVGGGSSGLATAHYPRHRLGASVHLTLVDGAPELGGKTTTRRIGSYLVDSAPQLGGETTTRRVDGHLVDTGPDALRVCSPPLAALPDDLRLTDQLVPPAVQTTHVWFRDRLRQLPRGTLFGPLRNKIPTVSEARRWLLAKPAVGCAARWRARTGWPMPATFGW